MSRRNHKGYRAAGIRTYEEVAAILNARGRGPITRGGVFMAEQRALKKLRKLLGPFLNTNQGDR